MGVSHPGKLVGEEKGRKQDMKLKYIFLIFILMILPFPLAAASLPVSFLCKLQDIKSEGADTEILINAIDLEKATAQITFLKTGIPTSPAVVTFYQNSLGGDGQFDFYFIIKNVWSGFISIFPEKNKTQIFYSMHHGQMIMDKNDKFKRGTAQYIGACD